MTEREWEGRFEPLMHRLDELLQLKNRALNAPRKPALVSDVVQILFEATGDPDVEQWLFQEASIEEAKCVLLGFYQLLLELGPAVSEQVRQETMERLKDVKDVKSMALASANRWGEN